MNTNSWPPSLFFLWLSPFISPSLWLECSSVRLFWLISGASQPSLLVPASTLNIWLVLADLLIFVLSYISSCCCKADTYFSNKTPTTSTQQPEHTVEREGEQSKWAVYLISEVKTHIAWLSSGTTICCYGFLSGS